MGRKFEQNHFNIPPPKILDGRDETVRFFLVGDEIFPLKEWLMHPFAGKQLTNEMRKVFNYRLSSSKSNRGHFRNFNFKWKIFQRPIEEKPELVEKNVLAATALHNYLQ